MSGQNWLFLKQFKIYEQCFAAGRSHNSGLAMNGKILPLAELLTTGQVESNPAWTLGNGIEIDLGSENRSNDMEADVKIDISALKTYRTLRGIIKTSSSHSLPISLRLRL